MKKISYIFFFLLGLFTLLSQTILLREYIYFFRGNELSIAFFYFSWFFWIAAGALAAKSFWRVCGFIERNFDLFTVVYPLLLPLQILSIRYLRTLAGYEPYEVIPPHVTAVSALLSNLPLSFFTGMLFTSGSARFARFAGRAVSTGFIVESAGSFAGGAAATYLIYTALQPIDAAYIASAFFIAIPFLSVFSDTKIEGLRRSGFFIPAISAVLLAGLIACYLAGGFARMKDFAADARFSGAVPEASLIKDIDTEYQSVSIGKLRDQHLALLNGTVSLSFPFVEERRALTGILFGQKEGIDDVLLIGEGALQVVDAALEYPVRAVTLMIPDFRLLEAIKETIPEKDIAFLSDKRLRIICGDPRLEIRKMAEARHEFDLVLVLTG
ncbi:MAG: hypothetical protein FJ088_08040, partial [Deltaproteobacteria bacterium]|nr:hypothetical protein [Deltaproteobacteria bacterium]